MQTTSSSRTIKIQPKRINKGWNQIKEIPQLLLQGDWFRRAGFQPGDHVEVKISNGQLIIRPCVA